MKRVLIKIIRLYQACFRPFFGHNCRFSPSCSVYAIDAINEYGAFKGFLKAAYRVLRCNPFSSGGYDRISPKAKLSRSL